MRQDNDAILAVAVIVVGLGILLLFPGLGILYFITMIPLIIVIRRYALLTGSPDTFQADNPLAAPQTQATGPTTLRQQPASALIIVCCVLVSLIAASVAFGVTCTAGVFSTLVLSDALGLPFDDDKWLPVMILVIPLVSFAAAFAAFFFLFRLLMKNR